MKAMRRYAALLAALLTALPLGMKLSGLIAVVSASHHATAADAVPDCFPPGAPEIPDGAVASVTDMVAAQQRMKLFRESAEIYAACMDDRFKRFGPRVPERRRERWTKEREKLATSLQTATQRYNESVRAYRAKHDQPETPAGGAPGAPATPPKGAPQAPTPTDG
jgi:hypothetical protein